jgi:hypothetical protein
MMQKETDQTWQQMQEALKRLQALSLGGAYKLSGYLTHIKSIRDPIVNSVSSQSSFSE